MMSRLTTLVLFAALMGASAPLASPPADPSNLTVHEWGTFTTIAGDDGRPVEWSAWAGPQDLPCFVEKLKWCAKCTPGATVRMETPVLYFYGPQPAKLDVSVKFRQGLLTEWYPRAAASPDTIPQTGLSRPFTHSLRWPAVDVTPGAAEHFPTEAKKNHYYAARETDAAPLRVGSQQEKFLFYRGIGRFEIPIVATTPDSTRVVVKNTGREPLAAVVLFENRGGRIGYRISHGVTGEQTFATPALDGGLDRLTGELERVLVAEGLFAREARAMIETWRDSWFEEGSRLFYIVPPRLVDHVLPLRIDPAPAALSRVFVGRVELFTAATRDDVSRAIASNDPGAAGKYGRFVPEIMNRLFPAATTSRAERSQADRVMQPVYASLSPGSSCASPSLTSSGR